MGAGLFYWKFFKNSYYDCVSTMTGKNKKFIDVTPGKKDGKGAFASFDASDGQGLRYFPIYGL